MKKFLVIIVVALLALPVFAKADKTSSEYLKNRKHFSVMNPVVESIAQKVIKKSLQKDIGKGNYKVKFDGYTLFSMKRGIFKNLEITGKDLDVEGISVPYLSLKTVTDYNWIDISQDPVKIKSDMEFSYEMELTEKSISEALKHEDYKKTLAKINKRAYPLFALHDVRIRIRHDKVHIIMDYSLPLSSYNKRKTFMVSSNFVVDNGKIKASNIGVDNAYGNLPLDKVTNLVNLLDPLSFALDIMKDEKCTGNIENVKIENNIIKISGKMYIKGVN